MKERGSKHELALLLLLLLLVVVVVVVFVFGSVHVEVF